MSKVYIYGPWETPKGDLYIQRSGWCFQFSVDHTKDLSSSLRIGWEFHKSELGPFKGWGGYIAFLFGALQIGYQCSEMSRDSISTKIGLWLQPNFYIQGFEYIYKWSKELRWNEIIRKEMHQAGMI